MRRVDTSDRGRPASADPRRRRWTRSLLVLIVLAVAGLPAGIAVHRSRSRDRCIDQRSDAIIRASLSRLAGATHAEAQALALRTQGEIDDAIKRCG